MCASYNLNLTLVFNQMTFHLEHIAFIWSKVGGKWHFQSIFPVTRSLSCCSTFVSRPHFVFALGKHFIYIMLTICICIICQRSTFLRLSNMWGYPSPPIFFFYVFSFIDLCSSTSWLNWLETYSKLFRNSWMLGCWDVTKIFLLSKYG